MKRKPAYFFLSSYLVLVLCAKSHSNEEAIKEKIDLFSKGCFIEKKKPFFFIIKLIADLWKKKKENKKTPKQKWHKMSECLVHLSAFWVSIWNSKIWSSMTVGRRSAFGTINLHNQNPHYLCASLNIHIKANTIKFAMCICLCARIAEFIIYYQNNLRLEWWN